MTSRRALGRRRRVAHFGIAIAFGPWEARAQPESTANPVATGEASDVALTVETAVSSATREEQADEAALAAEEERLERLQAIYSTARRVIGQQHVFATIVATAGQRCKEPGDRAVWSCDRPESQGGLGGLVVVPLFGAGGGHGPDWWPVIETDDAAEGFYRLDRQFRRMRDALRARYHLPDGDRASEATLSRRYARLAEAFTQVLARMQGDANDPGANEDEMERLMDCLERLTAAPVLHRDGRSSQPLEPSPATLCNDGATNGQATRGWTLQEKLSLLDALWREHDLLVDASPLARHNFLLGPLAGAGLTGDSGDMLYGAGFEIGTQQAFRVTVAGGLRSDMRGPLALGTFDAVGWWAGLGLSGQLGDRLIDSWLGSGDVFDGDAGGTP